MFTGSIYSIICKTRTMSKSVAFSDRQMCWHFYTAPCSICYTRIISTDTPIIRGSGVVHERCAGAVAEKPSILVGKCPECGYPVTDRHTYTVIQGKHGVDEFYHNYCCA
jgi:hypothetical protein